jgi:TonB family protein
MLELEDLRPETPSVGRVISPREAILMSLVLHLSLVIIYLLLPAGFFSAPDAAQAAQFPSPEVVRFVQMDTPASRVPPKQPKVHSDVDRSAASPMITPKPADPEPASKGNTDDRSVATPAEKPRGPETSDPNAGAPSKAVPQASAFTQPAVSDQPLGGGMLGQAVRNFDRYTQGSAFSNPTGQGSNQPDFQFDSKGLDFGPWLDRFVRMVKHNWLVPEAAMTMSGHVVIHLNIHKNGMLTDIEIIEPSKISSFNTAAVNALRTSNPGIALPTEYPVDPMAMTVIFYYNERIR